MKFYLHSYIQSSRLLFKKVRNELEEVQGSARVAGVLKIDLNESMKRTELYRSGNKKTEGMI